VIVPEGSRVRVLLPWTDDLAMMRTARQSWNHRRASPLVFMLAFGLLLSASMTLGAQEAQRQFERLLAEGQLKAQQRDFTAAIDSFTALLRVHPDDPLVLFHRAHARAELGDHQGASEDLQKIMRHNIDVASAAVRKNANDKLSLTALAFAQFETGDFRASIDNYSKVLSLDPSDVNALFGRANARQMSGDREGALSDYTAALGHDTRTLRPEIYVARAKTRFDLGDLAGANEDLQLALQRFEQGNNSIRWPKLRSHPK